MNSRIFDCAQTNNSERMEILLGTDEKKRKILANGRNKKNLTPLHIACDWNAAQCVRVLLEAGANREAVDDHGRNAFSFAKRGGFIEIINMLETYYPNGSLINEKIGNKGGASSSSASASSSSDVKENNAKISDLTMNIVQASSNPIKENSQEKEVRFEAPLKRTASYFSKSSKVPKMEDDESVSSAGYSQSDDELDSPIVSSRIQWVSTEKRKQRPKSNPNKISPISRVRPVTNQVSKNTGSETKSCATTFDIIKTKPISKKETKLVTESKDFDENEKQVLLNMKRQYFKINLQGAEYTIHARLLQNDSEKKVICCHGFSYCQSGYQWIKLAAALHQRGWDVILLDLPGFGKSSGATHQTRIWKNDGPDIVKTILEGLSLPRICVIGRCGGAATLMRTFVKYPHLFHKRFLTHNSVIGEWPLQFDNLLQKTKTKLMVTWCADPDHSKMCVAYKHLNFLRKTNFENVKFMDIDLNFLGSGNGYVEGITRTNFVNYNIPSPEYLKMAITHLEEAYAP
ncbi:predicted protein [Naegleria gruberi]|uniref:Predicted protein n=1 Tax=Naegleria gruberi TaxID=5762 RepID=D2W1C5_NAEGR|nr:uncharacterized protein NAEGRDRAFT_75168 [Naegleria gruberi]EFC37162.1 predicted protein [Naegleria gruberi]|eukprot:XP_002669906.1 predicted protein [Naegleria gruberi strain NEG-M]